MVQIRREIKEKKEPPKCYICGDFGSVARGYIDPNIGLPLAKELVPCPKCRPEEYK